MDHGHKAHAEMEARFAAIQNELRQKISLTDSFHPDRLRTVAGVDLAYWEEADGEHAVCCIVVLDMETHAVLEKQHRSGRIEVPYIPGCLAFRELPLILETTAQLANVPDLYIFDGNGYLHPRHMGIATHAAFHLGRPTIGIAKTYYRADPEAVYEAPEDAAGRWSDITVRGEVYGRALRTHQGVKPVFVSVGNGVSLDTACAVAMALTEKESHIPLPTRLADLETHVMRDAIRGGQEA